MLADIWKNRDVAKAFLTERSAVIPDRPRQLARATSESGLVAELERMGYKVKRVGG